MRGRFDKKCRFSEKTIEFGWPFYMIPRCARGRSYLIEKWGDDLARSAEFQERKCILVGHFIWFFRIKQLKMMGTIWVKNHVRHLLRNNTLNENDNVNEGSQSWLVTKGHTGARETQKKGRRRDGGEDFHPARGPAILENTFLSFFAVKIFTCYFLSLSWTHERPRAAGKLDM